MAYRAHLRTDRLRALCDAAGISVTDFAEAIDMNRSSAYRALNGGEPGSRFIAGLAVTFGEDRLGELLHFAHEDEPHGRRAFAPLVLKRGEGA